MELCHFGDRERGRCLQAFLVKTNLFWIETKAEVYMIGYKH